MWCLYVYIYFWNCESELERFIVKPRVINVWLFLGTWSIAQSRHLHVSASGSSAGSASSGRSETAADCERSERRKSGDDILNQTVQSPRKATPTIFDAFRPRSKSDASRTKKPSTLIAQMKNAVQVSDHQSVHFTGLWFTVLIYK